MRDFFKTVLYMTLCAGFTLCVGVPAFFAIAGGINGCSSLKGADTAASHQTYHFDAHATTQRTDHGAIDRIAATQVSGGAGLASDNTATIDVTPERISVVVHDARNATTQPTTITVARESGRTFTENFLASATASDAKADAATKTGPSYSGPAGKMSVDGDTLSADVSHGVWALFLKRWPIVLGLLALGALFIFAPVPIQHIPTGAALMGAGVALLFLSDFWVFVIIAVAILIPMWPYLKKTAIFTRIVSVLDDWKSDMEATEKAAFNKSLKTAAGSNANAKLVDQVRVQAKHGTPIIAETPGNVPSAVPLAA